MVKFPGFYRPVHDNHLLMVKQLRLHRTRVHRALDLAICRSSDLPKPGRYYS